MLVFTTICTLVVITSAERALPSYEKDEGQAPVWLKGDAKTNAAVERWYIDMSDATCKPFKYLGSLGNFNNFVSRAACNEHLKFKPEEQANACSLPKHDGNCDLKGNKMLQRWYFKKGAHDNKQNECHSFNYNGCGGNANNFESKSECEQACQNKKNGEVDKTVQDTTLTKIPNAFDCKFIPEVKTDSPIMGIVPHKDGKKCVYAAVGKEAKRGFFGNLPNCVKTCIDPLVSACAADGPYQVPSENDVTTGVTVYYYFNKTRELCLPFMSQTVTKGTTNINDGELNIFSSVEMCASFCPAIRHIGQLTAEEACTLPKAGETSGDEKYKIQRYFYDPNATSGSSKCTRFTFNGKDMNLNNFKTDTDCKAICETPLSP